VLDSATTSALEHVQRGNATGPDLAALLFVAGSSFLDLTAVDARVAQLNLQLRRSGQSALNERLGKRVFNVFLQRSAERTRSVVAVATCLLEHVSGQLPRPAGS